MQGVSLSRMAWRNIWRNGRRTLLTLFAIVFGFFLAVIFTGIGDDTYGKMINLSARMGPGHVSLQHPDYQELPSMKRTVTGGDALIKTALEVENVKAAVMRITGQTMLATAGESFGAMFIAYDPKAESIETFSLLESKIEGEFFKEADSKGVIVGRKLAENLNLKLGRKAVFTLTDKNGEIVSLLARVKGIITTGAPSLDAGICLLPIDTLRKGLSYEPDEATQVAIYIDDQRGSDAVSSAIKPLLPKDVVALTWAEKQPELASFIAMKEGGAIVMELFIMILIAAGIFNTLFVSVMERMREFGILMAIGFEPQKLFKLVVWESFWLALVGTVLGFVVTAWPYYYFTTTGIDYSKMIGEGTEVAGVMMKPIMFITIYPESLAVIVGVVFLATMVSGLYPAWRAGRVVPVDTIKLV